MRIESDTATATSNSVYDALNLSATDLTPSGTAITYQYSTTLETGANDGFYNVVPGKFGTPKSTDIYLSDNKGSRVLNYAANDSFKLQATFTSGSDAISPVIAQDGLNLWTTRYRINNMGIANDNIYLISGGVGYFANSNGTISYPNISVSIPDAIDGEQAYVQAQVANGNIISVYVTTEGSGYLTTPTITVSNTSSSIFTATNQTASSAAWLMRGLTSGISIDSGLYQDASNNMQFAARDGSGTLRLVLDTNTGSGSYLNNTAGFSIGKNTITSGYTDIGTNLRVGDYVKTGTYSQVGTTVTITCTNHGITSGDSVYIDYTTGTALDAYYNQVTVTNSSTFTVTAASGITTSGNCTIYPESQIRFPGAYGDYGSGYNHTVISERLYGSRSEEHTSELQSH